MSRRLAIAVVLGTLGLFLVLAWTFVRARGADQDASRATAVAPATSAALSPAAEPELASPDPLPSARADPERVAGMEPEVAATGILVTGRVVDPSAVPLAGVACEIASLLVRDAEGESKAVGAPGAPLDHGTSGADGRFQLTFLPVEAGTTARVLVACGGPGFVRTQSWFDVPPDATTLAAGDIVVARSATIAGTVRDPSGAAVPLVQVTAGVAQPSGSISGKSGARTDERGRFEIPDAASGRVDLAGRNADDRWGTVVSLDLAPGEVRRDVELVVPALDDDAAISGVVLDPDGRPVPKAQLNTTFRSPNGDGGGSSGRRTDEAGRFRFAAQRDTVFGVSASDPRGQFGSASIPDVPAGTHGIELRLRVIVQAELRVVGRGGAPVERFAFHVQPTLGTSSRVEGRSKLADRPGGLALFGLPADPFRIVVEAPGHVRAETELFDPTLGRASFEVVLTPLPLLRGIVVQGGEPVAHAQVRVQPAFAPGESGLADGFDLLARPAQRSSDTKTDDAGRFELAIDERDAWFVRARTSRVTTPLVGPFTVQDAPPLVRVELPEPGAIEGTARSSRGAPLAGRRVAASNGDGDVRFALVQADGRYRLDGLAPGPWQVRVAAGDSDSGLSTSLRSGAGSPPPIEWDCHVVAGRATVHDLVEEEPVEVAVVIRDARDRTPQTAWKVDARRADGPPGPPVSASDLGAGSFRLVLPAPGSWQIAALLQDGATRVELTHVVDVARGAAGVSFDVGPGALIGRVRDVAGDRRVSVRGMLADGSTLHATGTASASGAFEFAFGVAGRATVALQVPHSPPRPVDLRADSVVDAGEL